MGDGAMCHYCRKYQCECNLTAEEWRERCKNAEEEVSRLKEALQDSTTVRNEFLSRFEKASAEVARLTQERDELLMACKAAWVLFSDGESREDHKVLQRLPDILSTAIRNAEARERDEARRK